MFAFKLFSLLLIQVDLSLNLIHKFFLVFNSTAMSLDLLYFRMIRLLHLPNSKLLVSQALLLSCYFMLQLLHYRFLLSAVIFQLLLLPLVLEQLLFQQNELAFHQIDFVSLLFFLAL